MEPVAPHLPNLFIIGAAKGGTSSLYEYLQQHPAVFMSAIKEPHYLCSHHFPPRFTGPGDEGFSNGVVRTESDYRALFERPGDAEVLGEASVYYLYYPDTAEKIKALNPSAKLIAVLRNPVDRAFSAYLHTVRDGRETLTFEEALAAEPERRAAGYQPLWWYREVGYYAKQVKRYLEVWDASQLKIFLFEDLRNTERMLREVLAFLELPWDDAIDTSIRYNVSGVPKSRFMYEFFARPNLLKNAVKPLFPAHVRQRLGHKAKALTLEKVELSEATRRALQAEYREDILDLSDLLHRDLSHWLK
ncbi:MAG: sulfotransferase [Alicyclobacillus sp.]|nr:sulfotransferase [Alicyclobacillus sp.]